jgi:hypothetical protein
VTLLVSSCGRTNPIAPASPVAPTVPASPTVPKFVLSGVVTEGGRPIERAQVWVAGLQPCSSGCSSRQFNAGGAMTDSAGHYTIDLKPPEEVATTVWAVAHKDGYVQQCVATTMMRGDAALDLGLTSIANLSTARPLAAAGSRTVTGVVFEATPLRKQAVEGVSVGWEALLDTVVAETRTDAAGRYLLCGLPMERIAGLFAVKEGYGVSYASVTTGTDAVVDIEISRH